MDGRDGPRGLLDYYTPMADDADGGFFYTNSPLRCASFRPYRLIDKEPEARVLLSTAPKLRWPHRAGARHSSGTTWHARIQASFHSSTLRR